MPFLPMDNEFRQIVRITLIFHLDASISYFIQESYIHQAEYLSNVQRFIFFVRKKNAHRKGKKRCMKICTDVWATPNGFTKWPSDMSHSIQIGTSISFKLYHISPFCVRWLLDTNIVRVIEIWSRLTLVHELHRDSHTYREKIARHTIELIGPILDQTSRVKYWRCEIAASDLRVCWIH